MKKTQLVVGGAVLVLVVAGLVISAHSKQAPPTVSEVATSTTQAASTTATDLGSGIVATGPAGARISVVPISNTVSKPDLNTPISYNPNLSQDAVAALKTQIAMYSSELKKDANQGDVWLKLAVDYKIAGDYKAAEEVWLFMTQVSPTSPVAFQDLGDLYQNFLKNYPKAETNYLQVIKLDPKNIGVYANLYTLYKYQYKTNTTAAADIVAKGLVANPNNPDLLVLQKQQ